MTKPNFKEMTRRELKKYILTCREDKVARDEALHELFINRSNPNAKIYPPPTSLDDSVIADAIVNKLLKTAELQRI